MKVIVGPKIYTSYGQELPVCINPSLVRLIRPYGPADKRGTEIVFSDSHSVFVMTEFENVMSDFAPFFGRVAEREE